MQVPTVDFRTIRAHVGSQNRAFEELVFQLCRSLADLPQGTVVRRRGTPDGGIEAEAILPGGNIWAWQAKYFFSLGEPQWHQFDESVRSVLASTERLAVYSFCVPYNLPAGSVPGRLSALERWERHVLKWKGWAAEKGIEVFFSYVGESDLLDALLTEKHYGRIRYWFDKTLLSKEWLEDALAEVHLEAGPRYSRDLTIEVPTSSLFEGLGRTRGFQTSIRKSLRSIREERKEHSPARNLASSKAIQERLFQDLEKELDALDTLVLSLPIEDDRVVDFEAVVRQISSCNLLIDTLSQEMEREKVKADEQSDKPGAERWRSAQWEIGRIAYALYDLGTLLSSNEAKLVNHPFLLIEGLPGSGKTHLLCDIARQRLEQNAPTVLLLGQRFSTEEPWTQILRQLGLHCSADDLLGALSSRAEAHDSRALLMIDAINEGQGLELWPNYLSALIQKVSHYPRVGLVFSCRSSYLDATVTASAKERLIIAEHRGFAGVEFRAMKAFFSFYDLLLPEFPLLNPEFQNPLFLKLMCKGLQVRGVKTLPRGESGITSLFEEFLRNTNRVLSAADRCDYQEHLGLLDNALNRIAALMLSSDTDALSMDVAFEVTNSILARQSWQHSLLKGLLDEGVLSQDLRYETDGTARPVILFSFQRLGDHLRAKVFLAEHQDDLKNACALLMTHHWSSYRNAGLLEALSIVVPERLGIELPELLETDVNGPVANAYLQSLIWRSVSAFPKNLSLEYLNKIPRASSLPILLQVCCVPGHPLNADFLHKNLLNSSMGERDAWWTVFVNGNFDNEDIIVRLIHWAWHEDTTFCSEEAALLCGTTLAWFLTSSNRSIRDASTKAIVALLHNRLEILSDLLNRFDEVDDLYVKERLYAAAYGSALLTNNNQQLLKLTEVVYNLNFRSAAPPVHILLREYARGIVESARRVESLENIDITRVRPPYDSPWPIRTKAERTLKSYFPQSNGWQFIYSSVLSWGDFNRYIIEHSVHDFLAPNQRRRRADARRRHEGEREAAGSAFLASLTSKEQELLESSPSELFSLLSGEQKELWYKAAPSFPRREQPIHFDTKIAARWIAGRVLALGWTPDRFERYDNSVGRHYTASRSDHRLERIGKKYQWIALHELMAILADHCEYRSRFGDSGSSSYTGAWDSYRRDIDPSLLLEKVERNNWDPSTVNWWAPVAAKLPVAPTPEERRRWIADDSGLPAPESLIRVTDGLRQFLNLESYYHWEEEEPPETIPFRNERCYAWYQLRSYLIAKSDAVPFMKWAKSRNWMGRWMPESPSTHKAFLGEIHWHESVQDIESEWTRFTHGDDSLPGDVLLPTLHYSWERGYDHSIIETVGGTLPSSELARMMGLRWAKRDFEYADASGVIVAFDPSANGRGPQTLLADREALTALCEREQLTVFWTLLGEKELHGSAYESRQGMRWLEIFGAYILNVKGEVEQISLEHVLKEVEN